MKEDTLLQVQAYLDNELSPAEARKVAEVISSDPEVHALYSELKETRELLVTTGEMPLRLQESREFYWSQIARRLDKEEARPKTAPAGAWWMKLMAPLAGAMALFAVLMSLSDPAQKKSSNMASNPATPQGSGPFHQIESQPEFSTITFRSESEGITVVWVDTD